MSHEAWMKFTPCGLRITTLVNKSNSQQLTIASTSFSVEAVAFLYARPEYSVGISLLKKVYAIRNVAKLAGVSTHN